MPRDRSRLFCATLVAMLAYSSTVPAEAPSDIAFAGNDSAPILTLTREHGMVRGLTDTPLVRVYADGLVHVHLPPYMKGAGHYQYRLEPSMLEALLRDMDAQGVMRFDAEAAQARRDTAARDRRAATGERFYVLDVTRTRIELDFASFGRAGETPSPLKKTIEWPEVAVEAQRYPQLDELVGLAAAEKSLLALMEHPKRQPVKAPEGE